LLFLYFYISVPRRSFVYWYSNFVSLFRVEAGGMGAVMTIRLLLYVGGINRLFDKILTSYGELDWETSNVVLRHRGAKLVPELSSEKGEW
jgi:hypothetical protein